MKKVNPLSSILNNQSKTVGKKKMETNKAKSVLNTDVKKSCCSTAQRQRYLDAATVWHL
jgi:hypothetical protein